MTTWAYQKLGNLCRFVSGGTPDTKVKRYYMGKIPWVTSTDIKDKVIEKARYYITEEAVENSSTNLVPKGNLLLVTRTGVGKVAVTGVDICISQDFTAVVPDEGKLDTWYLYYLLLTKQVYFIENQRGATIQGITREVVSNVEVPLPPLEEQQRIAAVLAKADRLRQLRRYALKLSDSYLQSVFLQMFGDPVTNPMGWEIRPLAKLLASSPQNGLYVPKEQYVNGDSDHGVEMVHMSDLFYEVVLRGDLKRVAISEADIKKYSVDHQDLLIARRSLNFEGAAKPCLVPVSDEPLVFESSMIRITADQTKVLPIYLYHFLSNERAKKSYVLKYVTRSTISGINQDGLKQLEILVPPVSQQQRFAAIVDQFERLQAQQREAARQADHLFDTLLHCAFCGEL